jgi:hypothetical protein
MGMRNGGPFRIPVPLLHFSFVLPYEPDEPSYGR